MIAIVCSAPDVASMNIFHHLLEGGDWHEPDASECDKYGIGYLYVLRECRLPHTGRLSSAASHAFPVEGSGGYKRTAAPPACLAVIPEVHLHADFVENRIASALSLPAGKIECLIFPSKHRAESGKKSFTVHPMGNYGPEALYGGKPGTLAPAAPYFMSEALRILKGLHSGMASHDEAKDESGERRRANSLSDFDVSFEVSHHGPLTGVPSFFIEIGSSGNEWDIPEAGKLLASVIMNLLDRCSGKEAVEKTEKRAHVAVGLGGGHYAPRFSDAAAENDIDFGHMIPGYALKYLDEELALEAVEKSMGHMKKMVRVYAHGKKNRKYYRFFEEFDAEIIEL